MNSFSTGKGKNTYTLLDLIGSGGMAEVYKCKLTGQQGFEKLIVLKKLHNHVAKDHEIVSHFIDEARLAALLEHENIATIYDFGEVDGSYFIAMEYLFGKDLQNVIRRAGEADGKMDVEMALFIASKICEAMEYAHTLKDLQQRPLNIIHRDLTPHNVFITYEGKVKIIDFGIAKAELFDNRTKVGMVKGKVSYMSPEQLTGDDIDHRSDIFAISILLYEMLSGRRMYSGDTATLIRKCMEAEYEPIEEVCPGLPAELYGVLHKGLVKDRNLRYQSCKEMRDDIDDCLFAISKRPSSERLKAYIHRLFKDEFKVEEAGLFARQSESTGDGVGYDRTRVEPQPFADDQTIADRTVVLDRVSGWTLKPWMQPILDRVSNRTLKPWMKLSGVVFCCLVVGMIVYGFLPDGEERIPVESPRTASVKVTQPAQVAVKVQKVTQKDRSASGKEIDTLMDAAEKAFVEERLTLPAHDSAYVYYRRILDIDPDHRKAREGIRMICDRYVEFAANALATNNLPTAFRYIEKGLAVSPDYSELLLIQNQAENKKLRLILTLVEKAKRAFDNNDLTSPSGKCAYDYYQHILNLDPTNNVALDGIQAIGDRYAVLAENAYRNLQLSKAKMFVQKGLAVVPGHRHLKQLQLDLSRSKPGIFFKSIEKNIGTLLNQ